MPFWRCYYHIIWATKYREALLTPDWELIIFAAIEKKTKELGANILGLNAAYDHIHVAVAIPPAKAVSEWVGKVKGVSSREINISFEDETRFRWQEGYGVMTFGETRLAQVREYIETQKKRHQDNKLNMYLERIEDE